MDRAVECESGTFHRQSCRGIRFSGHPQQHLRPAVVAIGEAKKQGVPSILIPHAHLDDDFYHFPDGWRAPGMPALFWPFPKRL